MNKFILFIVYFPLIFSACREEDRADDDFPPNEGVRVAVSLAIQKQQPELVLAPQRATRSEGTKNDNDFEVYFTDIDTPPSTRSVTRFSNTWLLQFATDGNCTTCTNLGSVSGEGSLTANLSVGTNTTVYLLGNGPATLNRPANLSTFEGNAYFSGDTYTDADALPHIAKVTNITVSSSGKLSTSDGNDLIFRMKRIAARLSLTCTTTLPGYRITSAVLYNAPQKMYYTYTNPTAEVKNEATAAHLVSGNTYTWFIGENLRGKGNSNSQQERYADKAPASSTFIRITVEAPVGCESTTYDIYPGKDMASNYDLARNWDYAYTTTITKAGASLSTDKRAKAEGVPIDLTAQPSNCYVVEPGKSYKFRINIKGEESAVVPAGMTISKSNTVTRVDLLWQDQPNLVTTLSYVDNQTAIVCFRPNLQGNALIMGLQGNTTEWSWHFWVLNGGSASLQFYTTNGVAGMDRNLGALTGSSANPGSVDFRGLIYEWGRKDPFPGAGSINTNIRKTVYTISGTTFTTDRWRSPTDILTSILHPDWYIYMDLNTPSNTNNWLTPINNDLWGYTSKAKTIFDPCPYGWRVPLDHTMWSNWSLLNFLWNSTNLCGQYGTSGWFPAAGRYDFNDPPGISKAGILEIGSQGYYWTSKPADNGKAGVFHFTNGLIVNLTERKDVEQTYGCSVRPVKVQ